MDRVLVCVAMYTDFKLRTLLTNSVCRTFEKEIFMYDMTVTSTHTFLLARRVLHALKRNCTYQRRINSWKRMQRKTEHTAILTF